MAFNTLISGNLGCSEADLPATSALFRHFERAHIDPDKLSRVAVLRCTNVALRETVHRGYMPVDDVLGVYERINDRATEAAAVLLANLAVLGENQPLPFDAE